MIERKVLSDAFQEALQGWRLRAGVFLTFRFDPGFFEQEILPIFFDIAMSQAAVARVLHLSDALRTTGPIAVYYDRRALQAGSRVARTDFQKIGVTHRTGYFHPKNVLLLVQRVRKDKEGNEEVTPEQALLVASLSANLTQSGWWENVEVAHIETVTDEYLCGFRDDLLALGAMLRRVSPEGSDHSAMEEVLGFVRKVGKEEQRLFNGVLVPRLFTGDRDLAEFLGELAGNRLRNRCLEVISPYFDDQESVKPLKQLIEVLRPRETRVFLPRGAAGEALCSERYWQALRDAGAEWATLPKDVVRLTRDADRFVHAKVYRFFDPDDRRETYFVGSVNLTNAGFGRAGNVESGFLMEAEGKRKGEWWLEVEGRRPTTFMHQGEDEGVTVGPGANLVLRFDWGAGRVTALWDAATASPALVLRGSGAMLGAVDPLPPRQTVVLDTELASRLREHLLSSSFVSVSVEGAADAVILVEEEGAVDKPPLLTTLSPDEILRFWSLLSDAQKQEFFEAHAGELDDEQRAWIGEAPILPTADGIFGTFAHVYLSFGNLERAVRKALAERRRKEAVDRLFGRQFDSLRRLIERVAERDLADPVRDYITILCGIQLLEAIRKGEPDFYAEERPRFELTGEARAALAQVKAKCSFGDAAEREQFFEWFERWFLLRAAPLVREEARA